MVVKVGVVVGSRWHCHIDEHKNLHYTQQFFGIQHVSINVQITLAMLAFMYKAQASKARGSTAQESMASLG